MKTRNVGLDICRILSMFGIVLIHIIAAGGAQNSTSSGSVSFWATEWLYICALCSVDVFGMMSGFLGIFKKKESVFRLLELIAVVLFYSAIITICFLILTPTKFNGTMSIIHGLIPPLAGRYWYITCFIPVLLFQPFINKMLLALTEKQHLIMVILEVLFFSCIPSFFNIDFFSFQSGYSFVWLLSLYSIGAYIARCKATTQNNPFKKTGVLLFFAISFVLLFGNLIAMYRCKWNIRYMVAYTSPLLLAMAFFALIRLINLKQIPLENLAKKLSCTSFDVYIIHGHIFIYNYLITDGFTWMGKYPWYVILLLCLLCAALIFILCSVLAAIRVKLFQKLGIVKLLEILSKKIDGIIYT